MDLTRSLEAEVGFGDLVLRFVGDVRAGSVTAERELAIEGEVDAVKGLEKQDA